jgi:hypothetical protein
MSVIIVLLSILFVSFVVSDEVGKIIVFGGSGKTGIITVRLGFFCPLYMFNKYCFIVIIGSECVFQALQRGRSVVVLTRNPDKLTIPKGSGGSNAGQIITNSLLTVVSGNVIDGADVEKAFDAAGQNVAGVIIALGGRTKDVGLTMLSDGTTNIINSMIKRDIKRVSVVTSIGCGDSMKQAPYSFWFLMLTVMRNIMADKNNQEQLFLSPTGIGHNLE